MSVYKKEIIKVLSKEEVVIAQLRAKHLPLLFKTGRHSSKKYQLYRKAKHKKKIYEQQD